MTAPHPPRETPAPSADATAPNLRHPAPNRPARSRSWVDTVFFHGFALVTVAVATGIAGYAVVIVSFGTATCDNTFDPAKVAELRRGLAVVGAAWAAAPALWAVLAGVARRVWVLWALMAVGFALVAGIMVASVHQVSRWCF